MFAVCLHSGVQYFLALWAVRYSAPQTSQILGSTVFGSPLYRRAAAAFTALTHSSEQYLLLPEANTLGVYSLRQYSQILGWKTMNHFAPTSPFATAARSTMLNARRKFGVVSAQVSPEGELHA